MISMDPVLTEHVVSLLGQPKEPTVVSHVHNNSKHEDKEEVQAFAKLSGRDWTFYISSLNVSIGRGLVKDATQTRTLDSFVGADIDLGPGKIVSRKHAEINYNQSTGNWELHVNGRNGAKINFTKVQSGPNSPNIQLFSGTIIDINGTQMMFILPDTPPMLTKFAIASIQRTIPLDHPIYKLGFPLPNIEHSNFATFQHNQNFGTSGGLIGTDSNMYNGLNNIVSSSVNLGNSGASLGVIVGERTSKNIKDDYRLIKAEADKFDKDLSLDEHKNIKPTHSYATLITQAFLSNPEGELALADIYKYICDNYAYYRFKKPNWQNSVRHNLSLNKAFERVDRRAKDFDDPEFNVPYMMLSKNQKKNDARKHYRWRVSAIFQAEFIVRLENGRLGSLKRGTTIINQLYKYYAEHGKLPIQEYYPEELVSAYHELMGTGPVPFPGNAPTLQKKAKPVADDTKTKNDVALVQPSSNKDKAEGASVQDGVVTIKPQGEKTGLVNDFINNTTIVPKGAYNRTYQISHTQDNLVHSEASRKYQINNLAQTAFKIEQAYGKNEEDTKNEGSAANEEINTGNQDKTVIIDNPKPTANLTVNTKNNLDQVSNRNSASASPNKTHLLLDAFQHYEQIEKEQQKKEEDFKRSVTPGRPYSGQTYSNTNDNNNKAGTSNSTSNGDEVEGNTQNATVTNHSNAQKPLPSGKINPAGNGLSPGVLNLLQFSSVNNTPAIQKTAETVNKTLKQQSNLRMNDHTSEGNTAGIKRSEDGDINSSPLKRKKLSNFTTDNKAFVVPNVLDLDEVKVVSKTQDGDAN